MAGKPWAKVWPEKWLASQRTRSLDYETQGLYWAVFLRAAAANERGELRVGPRPWTVADLALDLGLDRRRVARLEQRLDRLVAAGLLERQADGCLAVARWGALQAGPAGGGQGAPEPALAAVEAPSGRQNGHGGHQVQHVADVVGQTTRALRARGGRGRR